MNKEKIQIRVFVSCPSDIKEEKAIVAYLCDEINQKYRDKFDISLLMLDWEKSAIPQFGPRPQAKINQDIKEYDVFIGILWKKFGTPPGAKNPNTGENYESGTEEEFEIAYQRWKQKKSVLINFYFKDPNIKGGIDDQDQIAKVAAFKKRLRDKSWIVNFSEPLDFERKVRRFLEGIVLGFDEHISHQKLEQLIQEINQTKLDEFRNIQIYLPRKVLPARSKSDDKSLFIKDSLFKNLRELTKEKNRVALIGDAGSGKTIELQRLACQLFEEDQTYYPFYLSLSKYSNQNLSDLLPANWDKAPQKRLFVILDGLDEIESRNKNSAFRQIELFVDTYSQAHVIVSCRTNFYKTETEQLSGTLKTFSTYRLHDLDLEEIEKYLEVRLANKAEEFIKAVLQNQLKDLLKIPFYLTHLIELYESNGSLPQSKSALFEQLLIARIKLDEEHYRTTIELEEKRKTIVETLKRLAIGMETLGRNYITNGEFQQLIDDESLRDLTKYCTAWKKNEQEATWQFEHNNFQEYLAAKILAHQPLELVKEFIAFEPEYRKIIPSWVNTLAFLLSISTNSNLLNWVLENEPELAVKFEPDKIDLDKRIEIFKEIFNAYKAKQIWINRDKFRYSELARFGQSDEIIEFLIAEIDKGTHFTTVINGIELLGYFEIPFTRTEKTEKFLLKYALNDDNEELVHQGALMAIANLQLISQQVCKTIVEKFRNSDSDRIRYALYYFIYNSEYLDQNIDIFLEGIKYLRFVLSSNRGESRLVDEGWHLRIGLEKAQSLEAISKILTYFIKHPRDLHSALLEKSIPKIAENAANVYLQDPSIFELVLDLFTVLVREHFDEETKEFMFFFDNTDTRFQAFKQLLEQKSKDYFLVLATLANSKCIEVFARQYLKKKITNEEVLSFQSFLNWKNYDLFLAFNKLINELSKNKFALSPKKDFEKERKERNQHDIDLLFDKTAFLQQVKLIFEKEQKETFVARELIKIETEHWDNPYFSDLALGTLKEIAREQTVSKDQALKDIEQGDWDWFCIRKIYEKLKNKVDVDLSENQKEWIAKWCYSNLDKVDFRTALITKEDGLSFTTSWNALILSYFLREFDLVYPANVLLDMLSFYWPDEESIGFEFLEKRLSKPQVIERTLENLRMGIKNNYVLQNHIGYCRSRKITEVLPFALDEIRNSERNIDVRRLALETVFEISNELSVLERSLQKISDNFKWEIIRMLRKHDSSYVRIFLRELLTGKNRKDKLKAAEHLAKLQDIDGLIYYCNWIKRHNEFPTRFHDKSPLQQIKVIEAAPYLIQLLELSYKKNIVEDEFNSLRQNVLAGLTEIALESESNYFGIKKVVENFIKKHHSEYENVNILHSFIERLEQQFYVVKSEKFDIEDVIKKFERIQ